ncbi:hypothetical protein CCACVL1_27241 [Corchorus capsularis]|uniref:Uncharacterized protein n=1 Tax=Corchorus capsularis TaxID=210143 RepID=A0A1R3GBK7_COCAP|nr:hypothetical protein CCACVL1_27241 [Corchorus capsularis]
MVVQLRSLTTLSLCMGFKPSLLEVHLHDIGLDIRSLLLVHPHDIGLDIRSFLLVICLTLGA